LIDENEMIKKHEEQLFMTKNQMLARIDVLKKQISGAMDHYRIIAHSCREKIEREEILQNEMLMDLKERVDKLNDMCTDINNQADDMIVTLNTYNAGKSDALYMITACSVDFIVRFFQQIYTTIISITKVY
uniref:Coiled-coil domain-containing protein 39 n=1 Tax=Brugia timori TaxID=42155 RepID=A0A0R3RAG7_9BILA